MGAVLGDSHDFSGDVLSFGKVNELFCAEPFAEIALFIATVDRNHPHALYQEVSNLLNCQRTLVPWPLHIALRNALARRPRQEGPSRRSAHVSDKTAVNAHNPLTRLDSTAFASRVSRDASTHDGPSFLIRNAIWKASGVPPVAQGILLEGPGGAETRVLLLRAMKLVDAIRAELAFATSTPYPFDAGAVSHLPLVVHVISDSNDNPRALVACDALCFRLHRQPKRSPLILDQGLVRRAETSPSWTLV